MLPIPRETDQVEPGITKTSVERESIPGKVGAYQRFLRLRQPIEEMAYPTPRVLESGRIYTFPFTFVVPDRLLPHACSHKKNNAQIERAHTMLPPSLGDLSLVGNGNGLYYDFAPEMSQISYLIRVTIARKPLVGDGTMTTLTSVIKKVRIIPAVDEEPPLTVSNDMHMYRTRKEKDVKRGFMRGKLGRIVAAVSQPKPIQLPPTTCTANDVVNTVATMHLRFDPRGDEQPPPLGTVWSKLKISTFFSVNPWEDYPSSTNEMTWIHMSRRVYMEAVPLSTLCIASAQWVKHSTATRGSTCRDSMESTYSTESLTGPSASFTGGTYYTVSVVIPITLPKGKAFVPTFHSCLVSRVYTLDLSVSYQTPNANLLTPTVSLKVPIQITCQRKEDKSDELLSWAAITQAEVNDEFFRPRVTAPPSPEYTERAILRSTPPEYPDCTGHRTAATTICSDRGVRVPSTSYIH